MIWLPLIIFVGFPLGVALLTSWWFAKVPLVQKTRQYAKRVDAEDVTLPTATLSLKVLRQTNNIGDKTVLVHHLSKLTTEVERKIRNGMLETTVMSLLLVVFLAVILSMQAPTAAGEQTALSSTGLWDGLKLVFNRIPVFFAVPVGMFLFMMKSIITFIFLHEQLGKFSDLLEP